MLAFACQWLDPAVTWWDDLAFSPDNICSSDKANEMFLFVTDKTRIDSHHIYNVLSVSFVSGSNYTLRWHKKLRIYNYRPHACLHNVRYVIVRGRQILIDGFYQEGMEHIRIPPEKEIRNPNLAYIQYFGQTDK